MLILIQELMHRLYVDLHGTAPRRSQIPKPCDHFDLIIGTGTGGLIAIMLGRLRLDLETCKEVYVKMTRKVFETDKTIGGVPWKKTLFKASKLEEAIRECVAQHTVSVAEGNDGDPLDDEPPPTRERPGTAMSYSRMDLRDGGTRDLGVQRHMSNASMVSFSARSPTSTAANRGSYYPFSRPRGNPNALLYDNRPHRTKTAVTAVYKGTPSGGRPAMLRSYDSRAELAPEHEPTIWEAGRATAATGVAFKPITIGQSIFIDEGYGKYNPAPLALDEACVNEWPGREVGIFVSVGCGKRPKGTEEQKHLWYDDFLPGDFAGARAKLVAKIEGCEDTHQYVLKEYLGKRGVNPENYVRLDVEVGVGEFGMNEWNRLADISTNTRRYLARTEVQKLNHNAASRLARIHLAKLREEGRGMSVQDRRKFGLEDVQEAPYPSFATELEAEVPPPSQRMRTPPSRASYDYGAQDNLQLPGQGNTSPRTSEDSRRPSHSGHPSPLSQASLPSRPSNRSNSPPPPPFNPADRLTTHAPTPQQYVTARGADKIALTSLDEFPRPPVNVVNANMHADAQIHPALRDPPPLPPKTPIPGQTGARRTSGQTQTQSPSLSDEERRREARRESRRLQKLNGNVPGSPRGGPGSPRVGLGSPGVGPHSPRVGSSGGSVGGAPGIEVYGPPLAPPPTGRLPPPPQVPQGAQLPYPLDAGDAPPPVVDRRGKPAWNGR
jgi:hypothetical protein